MSCHFVHKASEEGKLFGSVTSMEIADALAAQGIEVDRRKILLEQPIKTLGEHDIDIRLNAGVNATVKIVVTSEDAPAEPAEKKAQPEAAEEEK